MNLRHTVNVALRNLTNSKLRTILAMLGILMGTASVVAMVSCGQLATQQALAQFKKLGTNLLAVNLYEQGQQSDSASSQKLTAKNAMAIKQVDKSINLVAPYTSLFANIVFQGKKINGSIVGAPASLKPVIDIQMAQGRFISQMDGFSYFCVLGQTIYQDIKNSIVGSPIGKQILLGKTYFTIIGIAKKWPQKSFFNEDVNNSIFVPLQTSSMLSKYARINSVIMTLQDGANINAVEKAITNYIQNINSKYKLFFRSAKQLIVSMTKQKQILTLFLGLIGSISLLVGGIGVMNIMLVSVIERRREIGIRRAIGAKQGDIQRMFLAEAIILSLLGGTLGVIIGIGTSFIIADFANWHFMVFLLPPTVGFSVSVLIGIFFGFYPAYQASRLDPIETLRSE